MADNRGPNGEGLLTTLKNLKGNQRACAYTEPMWGIPYNLYAPLAAVYMVALGLTPLQIGIVEAVYFLSQTVSAAFAGVLTDKLGRRLCTLIFDSLAWGVPLMLWAMAQNFTWFLWAAVFNGMWRIPENSWGLLYVEDAPPDQIIRLYAIISLAGLVSAFVSPVTILLRQHFSLIHLMRFLYWLTFVLMVLKFGLLYMITTETEVGVRRRQAMKNVGVFSQVWDSRRVVARMVKDKRVMLVLLLITCFSVMRSINDKFLPLLLTDRLGMRDTMLPLLNTVRSLAMLALYLTVVPRLDLRYFRKPMMMAMGIFALISFGLFLLPGVPGALAVVILGVALDGVAMAIVYPLMPALKMQVLDREERARMLGMLTMLSVLIASVFAPLAGLLSQTNRALPMLMQGLLAVLAMVVTARLAKLGLNFDEQTA